jgi:dienelactone hydrolase
MTRRLLLTFLPALALLLCSAGRAEAQEKVSIRARDGLMVTADVYRADSSKQAPWMVLAHMAGSSRGEYRDIALHLHRLGINSIALDQRSGGSFGGVANETAARAAQAGLGHQYLDALPDIEAGIEWAHNQTSGPVLMMGSSYSASLALVLAASPKEPLRGVIALSPGEYLQNVSVAEVVPAINVPVLIVSPKSEERFWRDIFDAIGTGRKQSFMPETAGRHGASALIPAQNPSAEECWQAVEAFLTRYFTP